MLLKMATLQHSLTSPFDTLKLEKTGKEKDFFLQVQNSWLTRDLRLQNKIFFTDKFRKKCYQKRVCLSLTHFFLFTNLAVWYFAQMQSHSI